MNANFSNWQTFLKELSRRKVVQVVLGYIAFAWLVVQIADVIVDAFESPAWLLRAIFIVLIIGLPVTAILSWIFDLTSKGIEKTKELPHPSQLDIKAIPIIFHTSLHPDIHDNHARRQLKDYLLWSEDFHAHSNLLDGHQIMILFSNSVDAMRYAIRIQNHSLSLKDPLKISIIEAPEDFMGEDTEFKELSLAKDLARDAEFGAIVTTKTVKKALHNRGIDYVEKAFNKIKVQNSTIKQTEYIIAPELVQALNSELQNYAETVLYYKTPIALKLSALVFLTALTVLLWSLLPSLQTSNNHSLTILPFKNKSENGEHQAFVEGLSEDIFNNITKIPKLNVISRRSSQALADSNLSVKEIGELLKANWVLEGSITRIKDNIRISLWVTESQTGVEKWNQVFNTTTSELLVGNRKILTSLSEFLDTPVDALAATKVSDNPNKELYPEYLKAKGLLKQPPTMERLENIENIFKNILQQQNGFLPAMAGLCRTYLLMYNQQFEPEKYKLAEEQCLKTYREEETNMDILIALAQLHIQKGDFQQAEQFIQAAQSVNPSDVEVLFNQAELSKAQGNTNEAIKLLNQAILIEPGYWILSQELGNIYLRKGDWSEAIEQFNTVIKLIPEDINGYDNLGTAYFLNGDFDKAALSYEKSLSLEKNEVALSNSATMWFYHGDYAKASNYYLQAIQLFPNDYRLWLNLADTKDQSPEYKAESLSHYQHSLDLAVKKLSISPNNAEARITAAWCLAKLGDHIQALEELNSALSTQAKDPSILFMAAKVAAAAGDLKKGNEYLNMSIKAGFPEIVVKASPIISSLKLVPQTLQGEKL